MAVESSPVPATSGSGPSRTGGRAERRALDRRIAALAIPSLGALAAEPLYILVDTAIVGHLGTDALGGLAIAGTTLTALTWLMGFLSMGTTTRVATALGAGRRADAATAVRQAAVLAVVIGAVMVVVLQTLTHPIVTALGGEGDVADAAVTYLRIGSLGVPFQLLAFVGHAWWRGNARATKSLQVVIVANVVNIVLEVLFVYGWEWGLAGSAWGTVIAQVLAATWLAVAIGRDLGPDRRPRPQDRRWSDVAPMLTEGWRITVRTFAHVAVFILASATAARTSDASLGAHQIAMQLFTFLALCLDALAVPAQVFTGQAFGAGDPTAATLAVQRCQVLGVRVGVVVGAAVVALSPVLGEVFTDDSAVTEQSMFVLAVLGVMQVPGALAFVLDGALLGAADYRGLQRVTIAAAFTFLPVAVTVLVSDRLGIGALWLGLLGWMTVRALLNRWRWTVVSRPAPAILSS